MRKIFLAFLTTSSLSFPAFAFAADDSDDFSTRKARVVVSTPGQPVDLLGLGGSTASSGGRKTRNKDAEESAKPAPKYSMKPIVESAGEPDNDEPPSDFEPEKVEKTPKPEKEQKTAAAPKELASKKMGFTPVPKAKPAISKQRDEIVGQDKKSEPAVPVSAPPIIQPKVVKVETNAAADEAEKAKSKVSEPAKPEKPPIAEEKAAPVAEPKTTEKETAKANVKTKSKVEFATDADIEKLKFTFSKPTGAAVFERFGYYWLVFYSDEQLELPDNSNFKIVCFGQKNFGS